MHTVFLYIALCTGLLSSKNPQLTLNITNIKSQEGTIKVSVFNTKATFLKEGSAIKTYDIAVDDATETVVIDDLPKGDYAILYIMM